VRLLCKDEFVPLRHGKGITDMGVQEIGCTDVDSYVLSTGIVIYVANAVMDDFGGGSIKRSDCIQCGEFLH
jgi:hypothetical protein